MITFFNNSRTTHYKNILRNIQTTFFSETFENRIPLLKKKRNAWP